MKIIDEHLVVVKTEGGSVIKKVVVVGESKMVRNERKFFIETNGKYVEISFKEFAEFNDNFRDLIIKRVPENKTPVMNWVRNLQTKPSRRLYNILFDISLYGNDLGMWKYIEDIKPDELLRVRNCGSAMVKEFITLRNEGNPKGLEEDLIKYRKLIK